MINQAIDDRLEDAIDLFEETWSVESRSGIDQLLAEHGLSGDEGAIAELVRIDIERRYEMGMSVELIEYLDRFGILRQCPQRIAEIAFEDYRVRQDKGYSIAASRWSKLPGIGEEPWYRQLRDQDRERGSRPARMPDRSRTDPSHDSAFDLALEEAGFHLIQQIGEGAFSRVYLATQAELADRFVVLKIVNEALSEPECMAMLQHTNIVPIYSVHRILDRSVLCMPYTGRVTLNDFLADKQDVSLRGGQSLVTTVQARLADTRVETSEPQSEIPPTAAETELGGKVAGPLQAFASFEAVDLAMWLFERLAGALSHAHDRGVVHNDLKPSNVLIRNDGEPALLDFNLAQSLTGKTRRHAGGTLPYMSPEVCLELMGQGGSPTAASDVYSLGVMLFEFVTGRLPYPTPQSIAPIDLYPAVEAKRTGPSWEAGDQVTPGLQSIIERCLVFDPGDRYESAEQLQADLHCERNGLPLTHAHESPTSVMKKWVKRHPRVISSGTVAVAMLAVLIPLLSLSLSFSKNNSELQQRILFRQFEANSSDYLRTIVIAPNRLREVNITEGVQLLDRFELLSPDGVRQMLAAQDADERSRAGDVVRRHLIQLGIMERSRLSQKRIIDPAGSRQLQRLDQLLALAEEVDGESPSRSRLLLAADRAKLAALPEVEKKLREKASVTEGASDTEVYLESLRLISDHKHLAASKKLEALADRNSVPVALRWTLLGKTQYANHQYEDAILSLSQAIGRAPDAALLYALRGRAYSDSLNVEMATKDYRESLDRDPECVEALDHLASVYLDQKNYAKARELYDRLWGLSERPVTTLLGRSRCYRKIGDTAKAQQDWDKAMSLDCDRSNELIQRAKARMESEPDAAAEDLLRACAVDPDRPLALRRAATLLAYKLGRHEDAIEQFSRVIEMRGEDDDESARVDRALSYVRTERIQLALNDLEVAMKEPNSGRNLYQAACVHCLIPNPRNHRRAVVLLASSLESGFQPTSLSKDPDLESIRELEGFRAVRLAHELAKRASIRPSVKHRGAQQSRTNGEKPISIPLSFRTP